MKILILTLLLVMQFVINAQNCIQDTEFLESCKISGIIEPDMKIGFLEDYTKEGTMTSPLFAYDSISAEVTRSDLEKKGITRDRLKDLILTVTSIENIPHRKNKPFTFFVADGSDGKRYRYYISMATDTLQPTFSFLWGVYSVDEYEKFSKLINQTVYGKDNFWSEIKDGSVTHNHGKKYYPLKVTGLVPTRGGTGGAFFVRFKPENMEQEYYRYCENSDVFYSIFTLCNPRESHENIKNKEWEAIQQGMAEVGMKKEILELAMGKPDHVSTYQENKKELELWYYKNVMGKSYQIIINKNKVESISNSENRRLW